jgi:hypothetical protein
MKCITRLSPLPGYRLSVEFDDGVAGTVELEGDLFGPVFAPLRDEALFAQVHLDEFGVPCWPCGADLAPDGIYARLTGRTTHKQNDSGTGHSEPRKPL